MNPAMREAAEAAKERVLEHFGSCVKCIAAGGLDAPTRLMCETGKALYVARANAEEAFERHARVGRKELR